MGAYINPKGMEKEDFLLTFGTPMEVMPYKLQWNQFVKHGTLPVLYLDNRGFSAAGIAYDEREFDVMKRAYENEADKRPKMWFVCKIEDLVKVSDLLEYAPDIESKIVTE